MKFSGGYNVSISGRPSSELAVLPEPRQLHIPLRTRRFHFSRLEVSQDDRVQQGQVLARDTDNFAIPLLSPRRGTVCLNKYEGHITLEDIETAEEEPFDPDSHHGHVPHGRWGESGMKRFQLKEQGVWEFFFRRPYRNTSRPHGAAEWYYSHHSQSGTFYGPRRNTA